MLFNIDKDNVRPIKNHVPYFKINNRKKSISRNNKNEEASDVLLKNIKQLHNETKIKIDIIICRFLTPICWLEFLLTKYPINTVWIYDKSPDDNQMNEFVKKLQYKFESVKFNVIPTSNVGSCDFVYLTHMIYNSKNESDVCFFLKDTLRTHVTNLVNDKNLDINLFTLCNLLNSIYEKKNEDLMGFCGCIYNQGEFADIEYDKIKQFIMKDYKSKLGNFVESNFQTYDQWLNTFMNTNKLTKIKLSLGGLYYISTCRIQRIHTDVLKEFSNQISISNNNEISHFVERSYGLLCHNLLYPIRSIENTVVVSCYITCKEEFNEGSMSISLKQYKSVIKSILYTNCRSIIQTAQDNGWTVIYEDTVFETSAESNMYAKKFKMQPHKLKEIIEINPDFVFWVDYDTATPNLPVIVDVIDSCNIKNKAIIGNDNFCGGGVRGSVLDEFLCSMEQNIYFKQENEIKNYILSRINFHDQEGGFYWCRHLLYNMKHEKTFDILNSWYEEVINSGILQDQIIFHFIYQANKINMSISDKKLIN